MNTAVNPLSGEIEECTRTNPPHFEHDPVMVIEVANNVMVTCAIGYIDTVDYDDTDEYCRVRRLNESETRKVWVGDLRMPPYKFREMVQ